MTERERAELSAEIIALKRELERRTESEEALFRDLITAHERGRPCEHLTLSRPGLPCPHPDCTKMTSKWLRVARRQGPPLMWRSPGATPSLESGTRIDTLWREEFRTHDGESFWGWRLVSEATP